MVPQSSRTSKFAPAARPRRSPRFARLRCEAFEDRVTPALFNVASPLIFSGMNNNGCVAVGDFNKDGRMDAVMSNYGQTGQPGTTITVLYNNGSGGFNRVNISTGGTNVSFVAVADINNDSWPDIVAVNGNGGNIGSVSVFANDGFGNFFLAGGSPFASGGNNTSWVGLADITGDNVLDIVVGSFGKEVGSDVIGNNVTIFQGNGNFTFSAGPITTLRPGLGFVPTALAVADLDGDGIQDIAAAVPGVPPDFGQPYPPGDVYIFRGTGAGGFAAANIYESGGILPVNIQAADINNDGKKDLIIANAGDPQSLVQEFQGNSVGILRNFSTSGNISFGIPTSLTANCYGTFAVAVHDFNLDGKADIAAINYGSQFTSPQAFVSVYVGNGTGTFTPDTTPTYPTQTTGGQYLAVGTFDNNSSPDLIVAHASNRVGMLYNTTAAAQAPTVTGTQVNDGSAQRSRVTSLTVTFSTQVTFATTPGAAFTLTRNSDNAVVTFTATANVVGGVTVVTINNFGGSAAQFGSLADGRYTLTAIASQITAGGVQLDGDNNGTPGGNYVFGDAQGLFRMFGDVTGDRRVDIADFGQFSAAYGSQTGQSNYRWYLDFNGDGRIDIADFGQFALRYFTNLP